MASSSPFSGLDFSSRKVSTSGGKLSLALILLLAALLRLGEPGIIEFLHDEALLSLMAQDMAAGKGIPLTGIASSVGLPNPPVSVYIMAIPYALSPSPQFATLFIAALNIAGVGLLWAIARRYFGQMVALAAGLLYAVNPWAILYSRKIWAQDFHTPFILLALLLGLLGFREGKRWAQVLCLPVLFIGLQIHFAAWMLLPAFLWLILSGYKKVWWPALIGGIILAIITLLPYLAGLSDTLAREPYRLTNLLQREGQPLAVTADALRFNAYLATGLGLETWIAPQQPDDLLAQVPPIPILWLIAGVLTLIGIVGLIRNHRPFAVPLLLWLILPTLIFTPTWTPAYPHYFIATIPILCLLAGIGTTWIASSLNPMNEEREQAVSSSPSLRAGRDLGWGQIWRFTFLTLIALIAFTHAAWWRGMLNYVDNTATPFGFGTPLHYTLAARDSAADYEDVIVISDGFEILYDQEAAAWPVLMRGTADCVRTLTGDGLAVFPAHPFAVITAPNAPENPIGNLYQTPAEQVFPLRPNEGTYRVNQFDTPPAWNAPQMTPIPPAQFGGGARLIGYALEPNRMYLEWELSSAVSADYHYFGHFLNAAGDKLGQRDNSLWPGRFWCAGDRLISWVDIELPPDTAALRVGLYEIVGGGFRNDSVLDSAGNPVSQWVDISL